MPERSDAYQLPSWPKTLIDRPLWNSTMADIHARLEAREQLEASFERLMEEGVQASLDYIQVNVAPQIATLQQSISLAQEQIDQIIVGGTAPNALKLGGKEAAWYASAQAVQDAMQGASEAVDTKLADYLRADQKNVADGIAPLGPDSKVPLANLPALTTTATVGAAIAGANGLATPDDGDALAGTKSGTGTMFRWTWGNIKAALTALFDGRYLKLAGGTLTGDITINKAYPSVRLLYPGIRDWTLQVREEGGFHVWDNSGGGRRFSVNFDGAVWTSQFGDLNNRIEDRAAAHADSRAWAVANDRVANLNTRWVSRGTVNAYQANTWWEAPAGAALTGGYTVNTTQIQYFYFRYFQLFDPVRGWITAHNA
ncbi:hypothetical protein L907_26095 [Agrobacterium sp. C13]|nr:hypothetical protein L902_10615 [Agrobacterium radiobacter DSM 30147]KDR87227.1 hypothetical protein K538_28570 [Agrobacterium tumefaciens GW4]KVK45076.1 hypothetical protein L904_26285 [Agrobacterium sp. LY4]KVK45124.1 hypothetical protein L903_26245 [Agrobacterium sp. JL28]KVK61835.1 hypothetical protein L907_26095 [Agrobacterium sp. C13]